LRDGDLLKIGNAIFKFLVGGNIETAYHEEIYRMTIIDGLTQAYNKRYFIENLEKEIPRCTRHQRPLSLVMFDIDHFKKINDKVGHQAGDEVLREVAARIKAELRVNDALGRFGGEEFVVLLSDAEPVDAASVAERIRASIAEQPLTLNSGATLGVTVSIGIATLIEPDRTDAIETTAQKFVARADQALYQAKAGGRNRVVSID
jgi:diguanylate cyclase (GGDEF)-like protein